MNWGTVFSIGAIALFCKTAASAKALDCSPSAIASLLPANSSASINFAIPLTANSTFRVPDGDTGYPTNPVGLPALCAVSVQVRTPGNSSFGFGLFLPDDWSGRFLAVGNGGFAGGINWQDMAPGTRYNFATMSTDTGHNSSSGTGEWAYKNPEAVINWAHRAMHGSTAVSKGIIQGYYAQKTRYSYYLGCSTGGRQGLKEADAYPEDFDGIVAGAPAWWTKRLQPWTVKVALYNLPATAPHHIPPSLFPTIAAEVLKQCDPQDGVTDTIISDLDVCQFKPETLLCGASNNSTNCLTSAQLTTLRKIHSPSTTANSTFVFPNIPIGAENQWLLVSDASGPNSLGTDYVRYFLGLGPDWDFMTYNESIQELADKMDPGNATVNFDLSSYHARGGKILMYHGLGDGLIPAGSTEYFYKQANRTLNQRGIEIDKFLKLFWVPGMGHCSGTPASVNAPWYFSGAGQSTALGPTVYSVPGFPDAQHDVLLAMIAWVEAGTVPESIIATKFADERAHTTVHRQRPLCMYPKKAKYSGVGDINQAESWICK